MPDRIIRDRCRSSPTLQRLSDAAERAWWRLTVACDDYGRFEADPAVLLAELFKRRPRGWSVQRVRVVLSEWSAAEDPLIHLYRIPGDPRTYGHTVSFQIHQRDRESKPKYPDPPCGDFQHLAANCRNSLQVAAYSESRESDSIESRESRVVAGAEATGSPPTLPQKAAPSNGIPDWFKAVLLVSPTFKPLADGHCAFWTAMSAAYDPYEWLKWDEEIQKAEAWIAANPGRKPRALKRFLRNWFERSVEHRRRYATPAKRA